MKLLSMLRGAGGRIVGRNPAATAASFVITTEPQEFFDAAAAARAYESLTDQLLAVVDQNADGVNRAALALRRESDLLLTLGISDPFAAKAGVLAQRALELSNAGRGVDLDARRHEVTVEQRTELVSQAIAFVSRAEMLMAEAKKKNRANIDMALERQSRLIGDVHRLALSSKEL